MVMFTFRSRFLVLSTFRFYSISLAYPSISWWTGPSRLIFGSFSLFLLLLLINLSEDLTSFRDEDPLLDSFRDEDLFLGSFRDEEPLIDSFLDEDLILFNSFLSSFFLSFFPYVSELDLTTEENLMVPQPPDPILLVWRYLFPVSKAYKLLERLWGLTGFFIIVRTLLLSLSKVSSNFDSSALDVLEQQKS